MNIRRRRRFPIVLYCRQVLFVFRLIEAGRLPIESIQFPFEFALPKLLRSPYCALFPPMPWRYRSMQPDFLKVGIQDNAFIQFKTANIGPQKTFQIDQRREEVRILRFYGPEDIDPDICLFGNLFQGHLQGHSEFLQIGPPKGIPGKKTLNLRALFDASFNPADRLAIPEPSMQVV